MNRKSKENWIELRQKNVLLEEENEPQNKNNEIKSQRTTTSRVSKLAGKYLCKCFEAVVSKYNFNSNQKKIYKVMYEICEICEQKMNTK